MMLGQIPLNNNQLNIISLNTLGGTGASGYGKYPSDTDDLIDGDKISNKSKRFRKIAQSLYKGVTEHHADVIFLQELEQTGYNTVVAFFQEELPEWKLIFEDIFDHRGQKYVRINRNKPFETSLKPWAQFKVALKELDITTHSKIGDSDLVKNLKKAGQHVRKVLKDTKITNDNELQQITNYCKVTAALIQNPTDSQLQEQHKSNIELCKKYFPNKQKRKIIIGALACVLGIALMITGIIFAITTCGIGTPLSVALARCQR